MLRPSYESDPLSYDPIDPSNDWPQGVFLHEPPREYETALSYDGEFLAVPIPLVFVIPTPSLDNGACSYWVYTALGARGPSQHRQYFQRFDPTTGDFLEKQQIGGIDHLTIAFISQGRYREIWAQHEVGGIRQMSPLTWEFSEESYFPPTFSPPAGGTFAIDTVEDVFLCTVSNGQSEGRIYVYRLSDGEFLRSIVVGSTIFQICLEDEKRAYAVCDDGQFVLVDYIAGRALGALRVQLLPNQDMADKAFNWDPFARRILTLERELDHPDSGASNTIIRGFFPLPQPQHITAPIPLEVPREGRRVRVATRVIGDAGEGIAGRKVSATATGDASLPMRSAMTDSLGYAALDLVCEDDGSVDVEVATETE